MISIYGKTYAANNNEFLDSIFTPGPSCNGFYRKTPQGVYLSDHQRKPLAFIRRDGFGPVSFSRKDGRSRHMYALCSLDAERMGAPASSDKERQGAQDLAERLYQ